MQENRPSKWITVQAERILYASYGRENILCTMHQFPKGATLILRVAADYPSSIDENRPIYKGDRSDRI